MSIEHLQYVDTLGRKVIVRPVTDQQDQIDIYEMSTDVYHAEKIPYDYLPTYFPFWINSSNHWMYGIEVDGKLVGFSCVTLLDQGLTKWSEGLRIHKDFRNVGLNYILTSGSKILFEEQMKELMLKENGSRSKHGIAYKLPYVPTRKRLTKGETGMNIVATKTFVKKYLNRWKDKGEPTSLKNIRYTFVFRITPRIIDGLRSKFFKNLNEAHDSHVINISAGSARLRILESDPPLIPSNVIVTDWVGYDLSVDLSQNQWKYQYWWINKKHNSSLSFNTIMPRVVGSCYEAVIYASDLQSVYIHLQHHVENLKNINQKRCTEDEQQIHYMCVWVNEEVLEQLQTLFHFFGDDLVVGRTCMLYEWPIHHQGKL